jgi:hypothetical protein
MAGFRTASFPPKLKFFLLHVVSPDLDTYFERQTLGSKCDPKTLATNEGCWMLPIGTRPCRFLQWGFQEEEKCSTNFGRYFVMYLRCGLIY